MYHLGDQVTRWQGRIGLISAVYRVAAFGAAAVPTALYLLRPEWAIPPLVLFSGAGVYTLVKVLQPFRWYQARGLGHVLLAVDVAVCALLVITSGGLHSPFLLYTLTPVLTSALLLEPGVTLSMAGLSGGYVVVSRLADGFRLAELTFEAVNDFVTYLFSLSLVALLPYLVNANLRQRLQSEDIRRERLRISRELHDGAAQTMAALCWQVQFVRRRLSEIGVDLPEARILERLAERARQDTREPMEMLRSYSSDGSLIPHVRDYLETLKRESSIEYHLEADPGIQLKPPTDLELLRICQEALTNVRRHSGARNVHVKLKLAEGQLKVSIADDGGGFKAVAYYQGGLEAKGHGLAVMQERAQSIGGKFRVLSIPGQGTEVQVDVPIVQQREALLWPKP